MCVFCKPSGGSTSLDFALIEVARRNAALSICVHTLGALSGQPFLYFGGLFKFHPKFKCDRESGRMQMGQENEEDLN